MVEGFSKVGDGLSTITDAVIPSSVEFDSSGVRVKTVPKNEQAEVAQVLGPTAARDERNADKVWE